MSIEEVENVLFAILGRKQKQIIFSKKDTHDSIRISDEKDVVSEPYGGLFVKK